MNSPILWWTARRSVYFNRNHSTLFSRLAARVLTFAMPMALTLTPALIPVQAQTAPASEPQLQVDASPLQRASGAISSYAPIVEKVDPSVVTVFTTSKEVPNRNRFNGNPMFRHFFGIPDEGGQNGDQGGGQEREQGLGSGVIITPDGLILTNNHVAESGDEIMVRIGDHGHEYKAKVVGHDPTSDLAVLKIDAQGLPAVTFADSDQVKVGDVVLAIGNPFELTNTVTMGIVSALGRTGMGIEDYEDFIQTDAPINPGNSGGALVDTEGRLIGINTAIFSPSGGNDGIGFAVPSDVARNVVASLIKYGKVTRGFLGAEMHDLTPELALKLNVSEDLAGAPIVDVVPNGAAAKAGLQGGDIVTAVNGKAVVDPRGLRLAILSMAPGDIATITYLRNGQTQTAQATLGTEPDQQDLAQIVPDQNQNK